MQHPRGGKLKSRFETGADTYGSWTDTQFCRNTPFDTLCMGDAKSGPGGWLHGFVDFLTVLCLHKQVTVDVESNKNNAEFIDERTRMLQAWADWLDATQQQTAQVLPLRQIA